MINMTSRMLNSSNVFLPFPNQYQQHSTFVIRRCISLFRAKQSKQQKKVYIKSNPQFFLFDFISNDKIRNDLVLNSIIENLKRKER